MKKIWFSLTVALVVWSVVCISPHPAHAQSGILVADIPFDFYVGAEKLLSGRYTVRTQGDPALLRISDGAGHATLTYSHAINTSDTTRSLMIFNRYGDQYFLSEVRWSGSVARQLMMSQFETQIAKHSAPPRVIAVRNTR